MGDFRQIWARWKKQMLRMEQRSSIPEDSDQHCYQPPFPQTAMFQTIENILIV